MGLTFGGNGRRGPDRGGDADKADGTRSAAISAVRAYWEALRENGAVPQRDRVDPRGMASALEQVFIAERIAPGIARFRLAGMQINDLMGMEVRGMPLSALFEPPARARLADVIEGVFSGPAIAELALEAERSIGRPPLMARLLLLPLRGSRGEPGLMLGCLALEGTLGRSPRRFAVARALHEALTEGGVSPMAAPTPAVRSFAEAAPAFEMPRPARSAGGRSHLRVVNSDR